MFSKVNVKKVNRNNEILTKYRLNDYMRTEKSLEEELKKDRRNLFTLLYRFPWAIIICILIFACLYCFNVVHSLLESNLGNFERVNSIYDMGEYIDTDEDPPANQTLDEDPTFIKSQGRKEIQKEAVERGFGYWSVNKSDLSVDFKWANIPGLADIVASSDQDLNSLSDSEDDKRPHEREVDLLGSSDGFELKEGFPPLKDINDFKLREDLILSKEEEILEELLELAKINNMDISFFIKNFSDRNYREYPFTLSHVQLAESLNYDLEWEILGSVEKTINLFFNNNKHIKDPIKLRNKLNEEVLKAIQLRFDGFETWEKARGAR